MRTIIVKIETDSETSFDLIKDDIEQELSCCWNWLNFDKVEISEEMKGESMKNNVTGTPIVNSYSDYCWNRLPCGVCRLTNSICPMGNGCGQNPVITWATSEITTGTIKGASDADNN